MQPTLAEDPAHAGHGRGAGKCSSAFYNVIGSDGSDSAVGDEGGVRTAGISAGPLRGSGIVSRREGKGSSW